MIRTAEGAFLEEARAAEKIPAALSDIRWAAVAPRPC